MKRIQALLLTIALVAVAAMPAAAQFRIGPRIGVDVNSMRLNKSVFDNDNRAGFTGGVEAEYTIPVINLALDLSVMYVHRVSNSAVDPTAIQLPTTRALLHRRASKTAIISSCPSR